MGNPAAPQPHRPTALPPLNPTTFDDLASCDLGHEPAAAVTHQQAAERSLPPAHHLPARAMRAFAGKWRRPADSCVSVTPQHYIKPIIQCARRVSCAAPTTKS
ncbi:hypothetical protein RR46_05038 [Papilio xuthus]|uniref:Uncharacterized protein n=1 Tax=Papilio xuthus TaxID=66420 RepID=A0A194PV97_PAPXU|nr:hypothetical protein RR46_05038 [Papilio xuthus]